MAKRLSFDFRARGWTSRQSFGVFADESFFGDSAVTWMIPEFRTAAQRDYRDLLAALERMTKPAIRTFLAEGGRTNFCGLTTKDDLVLAAHLDQYVAWYPQVEDRDDWRSNRGGSNA